MEPCSRVRVAKCQMLATSLFVLLLGSAMAATAALSYFGPHFAVIGPVSADRTTYEALRHGAFSAGTALAALLTLGAMLSAAATVRGAGGLMAAAFLSFALVFCALVQAAFWRAHSPTQISLHSIRTSPGRPRPVLLEDTDEGSGLVSKSCPTLATVTSQPSLATGFSKRVVTHAKAQRASLVTQRVEDAVLDAYDRAYERALRSASESRRQELVAIQDTFRCCGKSSPLGLLGGLEADLCQGEEAARQDCLQRIQSFLRVHRNIVSTLIGLGLAFTVYAMLLSSFIWFTIRLGRYPVSQRARDHPPQEPRVYRCIQEGSPSPRPSKADAPGGHLSPSRRLGQLLLLQDTHPPTHGSGDATVSTRM
ncbi:tetraspanin-32 isoform X2 [Bubalus bubalis]|uniref:tetraspanin-32 isoform X2 n=1 Tax=Bubalus bubalis TaxID=89462 RepID=UPI001D109BB3|nr:tetraspanin-32 isoform X2 [Bubalus bubalis]